jgi:hypothetical protein
MNFDQAKELSFLVPWKTAECFTGPDCWCRIILPVEPILYNHPESPDIEHEYVIVDAGALDQETAEYFVDLHNSCLERIAQITPSNQELLNMVDKQNYISEKEMVETFEKLWANKHSKIGKVVRKEID